LNSKLFLASSKEPSEGQRIKQESNTNDHYQVWDLEYQGKNIYLIKSYKNPELMVGLRRGKKGI
jgi:hypothetical protein